MVPAATLDAPNVAFYSAGNTATAVNNPATNPNALDWLLMRAMRTATRPINGRRNPMPGPMAPRSPLSSRVSPPKQWLERRFLLQPARLQRCLERLRPLRHARRSASPKSTGAMQSPTSAHRSVPWTRPASVSLARRSRRPTSWWTFAGGLVSCPSTTPMTMCQNLAPACLAFPTPSGPMPAD